MEEKKVLFHGSKVLIKDFIEPREATDKAVADNGLNAVYATDSLFIAKSMSLPNVCPSYSDYGAEDKRRIFMHKLPSEDAVCYVYEVSAETFNETSSEHQFVSQEKVPILKTHTFTAKEIKETYKLANEEEFNRKWEKFGYPKPFKEFFANRKKSA